MSNNNFSRRKFLTGAAAVGAAGAMGVGTFTSCATVVETVQAGTTAIGNPEI